MLLWQSVLFNGRGHRTDSSGVTMRNFLNFFWLGDKRFLEHLCDSYMHLILQQVSRRDQGESPSLPWTSNSSSSSTQVSFSSTPLELFHLPLGNLRRDQWEDKLWNKFINGPSRVLSLAHLQSYIFPCFAVTHLKFTYTQVPSPGQVSPCHHPPDWRTTPQTQHWVHHYPPPNIHF